MSRASYRDRALVVRTYDFGEADRVVVLLTRKHGIVRSVAKGVRRTKSRFGSRLQPFVVLDVQLYPGKNLDTITQADTVDFHGSGLIEDYDRYCAGAVILEATEQLAPHEADPQLFDTAVQALTLLQKSHFPTATLDAFLLQAMKIAGFEPSLFACASCGRAGPHHAFHPSIGGAACVQCRPPNSSDVNEEVLHLMWLLQENHRDAAAEIITSHNGSYLLNSAHALVTNHLQWHLEVRLKALKVMHQA